MFLGDPDLELRLYGEKYQHFFEEQDDDLYDQFIFCGKKCKRKRREKTAAAQRNSELRKAQIAAAQNNALVSKMKAEQAQIRKQQEEAKLLAEKKRAEVEVSKKSKEKAKTKLMYVGIGVGVFVIIGGAIALVKFKPSISNT